MTERIKIIYSEIKEQCIISNSYEFEYHWEIWGVMWSPWFLYIHDKSISLSINDLSINDLKKLCHLGLIELVKEYPDDDEKDIFDRKKYLVKQTI